jgi:hypothetical protein
MAYEVKEAKVNPSRSLPTSVPTVASRPLNFATGRFTQDRRQTKPKQQGRRSKPPARASRVAGDPALRLKSRTLA